MDINELYDAKDNHFIVLLNRYLDLLISDNEKYKEREIDPEYFSQDITRYNLCQRRVYKKFYKKIKPEDSELKMYLNNLQQDLDNHPNWFSMLYNYGCFLRYAEKIIMYKNDPEYNDICSENKDKDIFLLIKTDDFKSKISITKSELPDINTGAFLDLINIEIIREFGKKMKNEFKFISGEEPKFNNDSDRILFDGYKKILNRMITDNFYKILDSVGLYYFNQDIKWKGYLNDGFWIRKKPRN